MEFISGVKNTLITFAQQRLYFRTIFARNTNTEERKLSQYIESMVTKNVNSDCWNKLG